MRVLLADLPRRESYYHAFFPNLGLLYIISSLRARFGSAVKVKYLDALPFPAWEEVDFRRYAGWHLSRGRPQAILLASRGCPHDCVYCSNPVWKYAKPWVRLRSPESIAREVLLLYGRGVREIYLSADEFNVEETWAVEVCRAVALFDSPARG